MNVSPRGRHEPLVTCPACLRLLPISRKTPLFPGARSLPRPYKARNHKRSNNPSQLRKNDLMHTEVLCWRMSPGVCSTLVPSPVSGLPVP